MVVSLHTNLAFPLAQVIVDIGVRVRYLIPVVLYQLMIRCPFAVPMVPDAPSESAGEGYIERMCGLISLLGAIIQTRPTLQCINPYGVENGWIWMASMLNLPLQHISPFIIHAFLETAGHSLWQRYQSNFLNLLKFIKREYIRKIPVTAAAGIARLELYIDSAFTKVPPGIASPTGSFTSFEAPFS